MDEICTDKFGTNMQEVGNLYKKILLFAKKVNPNGVLQEYKITAKKTCKFHCNLDQSSLKMIMIYNNFSKNPESLLLLKSELSNKCLIKPICAIKIGAF